MTTVMELTDKQWERLAYGVAHSLVMQALDNGDLPAIELNEYLPTGVLEDEVDYDKLQQVIEGIVLSDLHEEANKRDG